MFIQPAVLSAATNKSNVERNAIAGCKIRCCLGELTGKNLLLEMLLEALHIAQH